MSSSSYVAFCIASAGIGATLVAQAPLNVNLGKVFNHGVRAATWNFASGGILLAIAILLLESKESRGKPWGRITDGIQRPLWYHWMGGVCGATFVFGAIVISPVLGLTMFFVLAVAGKLVLSAVLDHYGVLSLPVRTVTWTKAIGIVVIFASVAGLANIQPGQTFVEVLIYSLLSVGCGMCQPLQAALNKNIGPYLGGPHRTALVSFGVGSAALILATAITAPLYPLEFNDSGGEWYYWTTGVIGLNFIGAGIVLPQRISMGVFFVFITLGELVTSLLMDHYAVLGVKHRTASIQRIVSCVVVLIGCVLIAYSTHDSDKKKKKSLLPVSSPAATSTTATNTPMSRSRDTSAVELTTSSTIFASNVALLSVK